VKRIPWLGALLVGEGAAVLDTSDARGRCESEKTLMSWFWIIALVLVGFVIGKMF